MADQRLPIVDGDDGDWGDILNQYLSKEHYDTGLNNPVNGGHKTITIRPGTTTAGTAPLKFSSGSLMTTPEAGAVEFLTDRFYLTQTTGTTRKVIAAYNDAGGTAGDTYYRDASGNFVRLGVGSPTEVLTVSGGSLPSWAAPTTTPASTTVAGVVELATAAEAEARTSGTLAITPLSAANFGVKKTFTFGDGSTTSYPLSHSLGSLDVITQLRQASDNSVVQADIVNTSTTVTTVTFAVAPATNAIKAVVMG